MTYKEAVEYLWRDSCTVTVQEKTVDEETRLTAFSETVLAEGLPCKLSFSSTEVATQDVAAAITQKITLFLDPTVEIPAGSKITVTRTIDGRTLTQDYGRSGEPFVFSHHQEIPLELWKGWA